jgi:hypothetical protein
MSVDSVHLSIFNLCLIMNYFCDKEVSYSTLFNIVVVTPLLLFPEHGVGLGCRGMIRITPPRRADTYKSFSYITWRGAAITWRWEGKPLSEPGGRAGQGRQTAAAEHAIWDA